MGSISDAADLGVHANQFSDFAEWTRRLESLTAALRHEANLNPLGLTIAYGQLVRTVRQRIKLERLWLDHPEISQIHVPPPIIVLGHMRSGTTRMQRMLACDDQFSATRFCDSWQPIPPRGFDWRPAKAWAVLKSIDLLNPQFSSIHPTSPTAVDEEIGWLGLGFSSTPFDAQWHIPSFIEANTVADATSTYRLLRRLIQTQTWREKRPARARVLKVPQFMDDLDALLSVFPKARIVHVSRDRLAVVASSCSLVANQRAIQSDNVDLHKLGEEWLHRSVRREAIVAKRLAEHHGPAVHVSYDEVDEDWCTAIVAVYKGLNLEISDQTLTRMRRYQRTPHKGKAPHHYRLEEFGLTPEVVHDRFAVAA